MASKPPYSNSQPSNTIISDFLLASASEYVCCSLAQGIKFQHLVVFQSAALVPVSMRATRSWSRGCLASLLLLMMLKCASVQAQTQTQYWTLVKYMSDKSCTFTERNPPLRLLKNGQW